MIGSDDISSQQKSRLLRVATLCAGTFVHLIVCWTVWSIGHLALSPLGLVALTSVALAGFLMIALLIGVEWNLTLEDPDMALAQMVWALTVVVVTSHFAVELKAVVLLSGLAMVVMGASRLSRNQQVMLAIYGLGLYLASVTMLHQAGTMGWVTETVVMMAFGLVLVFGPALYRFERTLMESAITSKNEELSLALEQIREMAVRDELTGLHNRRHLMDVLNHEKAIADRRGYGFSVCFLDLDYFKKVNDRFGHSTGDEVLRSFAGLAEEVSREVDCVARIGGEEFVILMSDTRQHHAVTGAKRLAERLREMQVTRREPRFRITASIGITEYQPGESIQDMLDRADRALYDAKRTGRNKIVVADSDP